MGIAPTLDAALGAFAVPITVVGTTGHRTPVATEGFWLPAEPEDADVARDYTAREPRQVMVVPRAGLPEGFERGAIITAPEMWTDVVREWEMQRFESADADHFRVYLIRKH